MKTMRTILAVFACATLLAAAGCTSNEPAPEVSPSPSAAPSESPSAEPSASPSEQPADTSAEYLPISANAKLIYDGKEVGAVPYKSQDGTIFLPLKPLAEAMGYKAETQTAGTFETLAISRDGVESLTLEYTPPSVGQNTATGVTAKKAGANIAAEDKLPYVDGTIYVPETFIDEALQAIDVTVDDSGATVRAGQ
ncbi:MAG: hypothetical protein LBD16_04365 [Oscillospiraceae bacterium]|jgi:hypothetical protein|nr:hypothetical protein [Oscillospiraceae bacterium]